METESTQKPIVTDSPASVIAYELRGSCYVNVTNRCTLRCTFCPKFNGLWTVQDYNLRLRREPAVEAIEEAVGDPAGYREVVFCGLGEPTQRLYTVLDLAHRFKRRGARIRINTDGLASLIHGRDVTPDLEGNVDALSVSLNAQDEPTYNRHCRPMDRRAWPALLEFVRSARHYVPEITLTAIDGLPGVDIDSCRRIADTMGVSFRRRVLDQVG